MTGLNVLTPSSVPELPQAEGVRPVPGVHSAQRVDPLSEVLALVRPQVYATGGFLVGKDFAVCFPKHQGVKCYAVLAGRGWLMVEGIREPALLGVGDCFLLPRGLPFQLSTNPSIAPVPYTDARARQMLTNEAPHDAEGVCFVAGGHFALSGEPAEMILRSLAPIVHIRRESDRAAMRSSMERMREELSEAQPGASLMAQHLAHTMLIQALRLHLADTAHAGQGWLFALSDKHMSAAIASMHENPGYGWTLQSLAERVGMSRSVFALRFRERVGTTPMEYLANWRMLLAADRLRNSSDGLAAIAQTLGYESESAFGKAFRRVMGCSPRQYTRPGAARAAH